MNLAKKLRLEKEIGIGFSVWSSTVHMFRNKTLPFHDSSLIYHIIDDSILRYDVKTFIETGTWMGASVKYIAKTYPDVKCYSCDSNTIYYLRTKQRLKKYSNIFLANMDSAKFIHEVLMHHIKIKKQNGILFWLDAHHFRSLPLPNELNEIFEFNRVMNDMYNIKFPIIIMIDDIEVESDKNYPTKIYDGHILNEDYLKSILPPKTVYQIVRGGQTSYNHNVRIALVKLNC